MAKTTFFRLPWQCLAGPETHLTGSLGAECGQGVGLSRFDGFHVGLLAVKNRISVGFDGISLGFVRGTSGILCDFGK